MRIFGVILAGGTGQRFGGVDKAQLMLSGQNLLGHVCARFTPQIERMAISANGDAARFGGAYPVLPDEAALGPLAGILAGLRWAGAGGADMLATVPVDGPYLPCDLVARLRMAQESAPAAAIALARGALETGARVHGTFGLWPVKLADDLAGFLASGAKPKLMDFAARYPLALAPFADDREFANINTPSELAALNVAHQGAA